MTHHPSPHSRPHSTDAGFYRFCPDCGSPLAREHLYGRLRPRCPACGFIQWRSPGVGVAGILLEDDVVSVLGLVAVRAGLDDPAWQAEPGRGRVLLVRRRASKHPGWCLPCGWVEYDEEVREALRRELSEETGIDAIPQAIFAVHSNFHDPDRQSVGIWFRCTPAGGALAPGDDADRICFTSPGRPEVPLAFPTDRLVLQDLAG